MARNRAGLMPGRNAVVTLLERASAQATAQESEQWTEAVIKLKRGALEQLWKKFQDKHLEIVSLPGIGDEDIAADEVETLRVAAIYTAISERLNALMNIRAPNRDRHVPKASEITLRKFDGNYTEWTAWRAQYTSKVYNTDLPADEKLDLLLAALEGKAKGCGGESEQRDADELQRIWQKLQDTYDNPYHIVTAHINNILDLPALDRADPDRIQAIIDTCDQELRALQRFDCNTEAWGPLIAVYILRKLDRETRREWEMSRDLMAQPALPELKTFLTRRILAIRNFRVNDQAARERNSAEDVHGPAKRASNDTHEPNSKRRKGNQDRNPDRANNQRRSNPFTSDKPAKPCPCCTKTDHRLWDCPKFQRMEQPDRLINVTKWQLCGSCLSGDHAIDVCTWRGCRYCNNAKHHRMLCPKYPVMRTNHVRKPKRGGKNGTGQVMTVSTAIPLPLQKGVSYPSSDEEAEVLPIIGTARFRLQQGSNENTGPIRAICDSGSQLNLITEDCIQRWRLKRTISAQRIAGVGISAPIISNGHIDCIMIHRDKAVKVMPIRFVVVSKISCLNPCQDFECPISSQVKPEELADPTFTTPGRVDALLGIGAWSTIIQQGIIKSYAKEGRFVAQETDLGWVVAGATKVERSTQGLTPHTFHVTDADLRIDEILERFWSVNDTESGAHRTCEEERAEQNFMNTHTRDGTGRYMVTIPLKEDCPRLGSSRHVAYNRFIALENKLKRAGNEEMARAYEEFMADYISTGHMITAPMRPTDPSKSYYISYHIIDRKKFRVVFDASCATSTGVSFNDQQLVGEKLQADLSELLLRFRTYRYALTADIIKMFRQIKVHPSQWDYQRIFFRPADDQPIGEYFITRVVWGCTSAGFNSVRSLRQCARDEAVQYPIASFATLNNFYIDDFLAGAESIEEPRILHEQMTAMLAAGGFELAKWATSNSDFAHQLKFDEPTEVVLQPESGVLGMVWDPNTDSFRIEVKDFPPDTGAPLTKRQMISRIARVYDPTGLFMPVVVAGKMAIQAIWKKKIKWDQLVPEDILGLWSSFHQNVMALTDFPVPRWIAFSKSAAMQLHLFSDASEVAFGSCAYLRSVHVDGTIHTHLLASRNKVAPIKTQTIPRLELMGAVMSIQLAQFVQRACGFTDIEIHYWTDSTIVIHWLRSDIGTLKQFVANRVSSILRASESDQWKHVPGIQNPADLVSRGCTSAQLRESDLWWHGPSWLKQTPDNWPKELKSLTPIESEAECAECKVKLVHLTTNYDDIVPFTVKAGDNENLSLVEKASTFNKLIRSTAFIFRYIKNSKRGTGSPNEQKIPYEKTPALTPAEREVAIKYWVQRTQRQFFPAEGKALLQKIVVPTSSPLAKLNPFIDADGLIRVGGRLGLSDLPEDTKHPYILPPDARFTKLIIADAHSIKHCGNQLTMAAVRQRFWIPRLRIAVRKVINDCTICIRFRRQAAEQLMGSLPAARTNRAFPFAISGVDFAGPFEIRKTPAPQMSLRKLAEKNYKRPNTIKCWVVVFVCFATHAVHLDISYGLSTEAFMEVYARFTSRRGQCSQLWSDNGTNFHGSNNELKRVREEWLNKFPDAELANYGTTWRFSTPLAPHQGGIWEAVVKQMKYQLRRMMGNRILSGNQLYTIITQIECCMNSRPLMPMTDDPSDRETLTPGHLLIGRPMFQHPLVEDLATCNENRLTLWGEQQKLVQGYWRRWRDDYILSLQKRNKWFRPAENLKPGDMVIVMDDNGPPTSWPIGRIVSVMKGADGFVRNAIIDTRSGEKSRAIQRLAVLPFNYPHPVTQTKDQAAVNTTPLV